MSKITRLCGCVFVLAIAACSSKSSNPSSSVDAKLADAGPTGASACMDEAVATCMKRESCSPGFGNDKAYGSETICETRVAASCVANLGSPGDAQTPTGIEACVASYPTYTCEEFYDSEPTAACIPPAGTGSDGDACGVSAQCSSTFCALTSTTICGECADLPAVGDDCTVAADCGRDLACPSTTMTCTAYVGSGSACLTDTTPCQAGLSCTGDNVNAGTMGTCQAAGSAVGAACDTDRKTLPGCNADLGLACISSGGSGSAADLGTCQNITLAAPGATCGDIGTPTTSVVECSAGGLCLKAVSTDKTGTCVAAAADGSACDSDTTIGPPCLAPAKCVSPDDGTAGICTTPNASSCM